jgi:hypothetical protein
MGYARGGSNPPVVDLFWSLEQLLQMAKKLKSFLIGSPETKK